MPWYLHKQSATDNNDVSRARRPIMSQSQRDLTSHRRHTSFRNSIMSYCIICKHNSGLYRQSSASCSVLPAWRASTQLNTARDVKQANNDTRSRWRRRKPITAKCIQNFDFKRVLVTSDNFMRLLSHQRVIV